MKRQNFLAEIIRRKQEEVARLIGLTEKDPHHILSKILRETRSPSAKFSTALKAPSLSVIGEIKRASPSIGAISAIEDPVALALEYCSGGVSALSVLTDQEGFGGSLEDLRQVSLEVGKKYPHIPILRKDFILHPIQLAEAVYAGASAALLIVGVVGNELKTLLNEATRLGLETLTEVHNLEELKLALEANCPIIGVNHRNLTDFSIDLTLSQTLIPFLSSPILSVAESGIKGALEARRMDALGFDAVLVGESLVRSNDRVSLIAQMKGEVNEG